jgi:hypothetical protein
MPRFFSCLGKDLEWQVLVDGRSEAVGMASRMCGNGLMRGWVTGRNCENGEMDGLTDLVIHKRVSRILRLTSIESGSMCNFKPYFTSCSNVKLSIC